MSKYINRLCLCICLSATCLQTPKRRLGQRPQNLAWRLFGSRWRLQTIQKCEHEARARSAARKMGQKNIWSLLSLVFPNRLKKIFQPRVLFAYAWPTHGEHTRQWTKCVRNTWSPIFLVFLSGFEKKSFNSVFCLPTLNERKEQRKHARTGAGPKTDTETISGCHIHHLHYFRPSVVVFQIAPFSLF